MITMAHQAAADAPPGELFTPWGLLLQGQARIRVQVSAAHTKEHLDFAVAAFRKVAVELGVIPPL